MSATYDHRSRFQQQQAGTGAYASTLVNTMGLTSGVGSRVFCQVHIAGLILTPIKNGKQTEATYVNIIKHADEFDLPVVARRLFADHVVRLVCLS